MLSRLMQSSKSAESPITVLDPTDAASEAYRTLRTSLLCVQTDTLPTTVVVTSPGHQEGKSATCANLGVVLAQANKRTLILDCALRAPGMHEIFGLRNVSGVANVLAGEADLAEVLQEPLPGLKVATSGPSVTNPAELLSSDRFAELIGQMSGEFEYVLVDTSPMGVVSDPLLLANQADGVLLVLDSRKTRESALRESMRALETVGANLLGTVMNNVKDGRTRYRGNVYGR
jgi:capsular exopolysaccharide synthesis family protein